MSRHFSCVTATLLVLLGTAGIVRAEFDYRSIFVDRFDYTFSAANINSIMQNAADQGFKHVIFQVRGRGDAFYDSNFEPRANGLPANFDPLQTAIDAAHSRGLKLHAWINTTPMWNTTALNTPAGHMFHNANPSFRLMDINGNLEPQEGWSNYSSANPILPEVHTHINNVVNDIATNYQVDGVHLDYIRYLPGANNAAADFAQLPHDPISHQMFLTATGKDASLQANFSAYKTYITGRITDLVASIKSTVDAAEVSTGRAMDLTASVWRDPDVGKNDYMQDYRTWLEQDLLDVAMPMIYLNASNDATYFNANLANTLSIPTNAKVAPNLASYMHVAAGGGGVALTLSQMQRAYDGFGNGGTDGVGFYDYPAFYNGYSAADRQAIKDFFHNIDNPPPPSGPGNVIDDFEIDEGHFGWPYNASAASQTFGLAATTTIERVTTEHQGAGVGSQLINLDSDGSANWQLRELSGIGAGLAAQPGGNVPLVANGYVGFWLKTDNAGITVRIAIDDPVGNTALERGTVQNVIADDQWHLYQWNLDDDAHWDAFAGGANGAIDAVGGTVTIDSIWLAGSGDAQIYLDTVSHNPHGLLAAAIAGDFNGDGVVTSADLENWQTGFGMTTGAAVSDGDADADGDVDGADFLNWQRQLSANVPAAPPAAVPEPSAGVLAAALAALLLLLIMREQRRLRRA